MSTRSNILIDDKRTRIQLYRHSDGYPMGEHGVIHTLKKALKYAWELPRFEADDFSAAIVAAWKTQGGGNIAYIDGHLNWDDPMNKLAHDIDWFYRVFQNREQEIMVEIYNAWKSLKSPVATVKLGEEYNPNDHE